MPRPLLKKNVQQRIKENKAIMKDAKKTLIGVMNAAMKGEEINAPVTRKVLASFLGSSKAIIADTAKLDLAE